MRTPHRCFRASLPYHCFRAWLAAVSLSLPDYLVPVASLWVSVMPETRVSTSKYTYIHDGNSSSMSAVDSHHVVLLNYGTSSFMLWAITVALLAAFYYIFLFKSLGISWVWSIPSCFILNAVLQGKIVVRESIVILPTLGVHLEIHYKSGRIHRRFVPLDKILKPVLTEYVTPATCYWSFSLVLRDETELTLVFQKLRPPLEMLVPVWKALCTSVDCQRITYAAKHSCSSGDE